MPLEPRFTITNKIAAGLSAIERARGFLDAATLSETWVQRMSSRALLLEAHHTTHIEGTQLTVEQAEHLWAGESVTGAADDDVRELLNYRAAFDLVSAYLSSGDRITEGLIREIHRRLVQDVRGGEAAPGTYRSTQNFVANSVTREIIYTPPPPFDVAPMMRELVDWLLSRPISIRSWSRGSHSSSSCTSTHLSTETVGLHGCCPRCASTALGMTFAGSSR